MRKRGVFFSIDAVIAIGIIFLIILIAFPILKEERRKSSLNYDLLETMSNLKMSDFQDINLPIDLITDTNNTVLEQIGEFYALGNQTLAKQLTQIILLYLKTDENVGVWYGNTLVGSINSTSYESATYVDTARQTISGIQNGTTATGVSARAFLVSGLPAKYYYLGGYVGDGNVSIKADYDGNITSADLELVVNSNFELVVNNNSLGTFQKSSDLYTPVKYNLSTQHFKSGTNIVEFKGTGIYIAGGFLKINYESSTVYQSPTRYNFPGIDGLINLYDGFYVPGVLSSLDIYLHINSSVFKTFLNIGNTTVFNSTTAGEQIISLSNSYLDNLLDYQKLSLSTIPLRLGMENVSFVPTQNISIDLTSVTDLSGSMSGSKMADAKTANLQLVDTILNYSKNRVGLAGFEDYSKKADFHNLSNNSVSLKNVVNNVWNADGVTCICCGILKALSCYDNKTFSDNFNGQVSGSNPLGWATSESGGTIDVLAPPPTLEGDRSVRVRRSLGNPSMNHNFAPQQDPLTVEFLVNHTTGSGRFRFELEATDSDASGFDDYVIIKMYSGSIRNGDTAITPYTVGKLYKIGIKITPGANNYDLYVNSVLVGDNIAVSSTRTNVARVRFTTETTAITYHVDDIKVYLDKKLCDDTAGKTSSFIVMSDGQANRDCGLDPVPNHDGDGDVTDDPDDHAIEAACRAKNNYNISVHSIGFDIDAGSSEEQTLQGVANCGNGSYYSASVDELIEIYQEAIADIISSAYVEQTIETGGQVFTKLYPDSYINFNYNQSGSQFGLLISLENQFTNQTAGNFNMPAESSIVETRVSSYSGPKWTDNIKVNGQSAYKLSDYGQDYIKLGDPYSINIPNYLINTTNLISLTAGLSPQNTSAGSASNKIIYTVVKNISTFSPISATAEGCTWHIQFEDDSQKIIPVPSSYTEEEICLYQYNSTIAPDPSIDAVDSAVFGLLSELDLNSNGKVDVLFPAQGLQIELTQVEGIPFTWSTEVQVRTWY